MVPITKLSNLEHQATTYSQCRKIPSWYNSIFKKRYGTVVNIIYPVTVATCKCEARSATTTRAGIDLLSGKPDQYGSSPLGQLQLLPFCTTPVTRKPWQSSI